MLFKNFIKIGASINKKIPSKSNILKIIIGAGLAINLIACNTIEEDTLADEPVKTVQEQEEDFQLKINYAQSITPNEILQIVAHVNSNIHKASSEKELQDLVQDKKIVLLTYEQLMLSKENNDITNINEKDLNILLAWKLNTVFNIYQQKEEREQQNQIVEPKSKSLKV